MHLETIGVNELRTIVEGSRQHPLYVGASIDPIERSFDHELNFSPNVVMYVAKTSNMNYAENQLLAKCRDRRGCCFNVQQRSNVPETPGSVYAVLPNHATVFSPDSMHMQFSH